MLPPRFKENLLKLSDEDLFDVLEAVSDEVKRRNGLSGLGIKDVRENTVEENVKLIIGAINDLGVKIKT